MDIYIYIYKPFYNIALRSALVLGGNCYEFIEIVPSALYIYMCVCVCVWSYASHGAQCGVITNHSSCGCCVCDYHICFRLFTLSCSSVPTLFLKDPRSGSTEFSRISSDAQAI